MDEEEKKRNVFGVSAQRKCCLIHETFVALEAAQGSTPSWLAVAQSFRTYGLDTKWNEETLRRFGGLGRRIHNSAGIQSILQLTELRFGRDALIDHMNSLRCLFGASSSDDDVAYILWVLYYDQVSQTRKQLKLDHAHKWVAHSILLRRSVFVHLAALFPKHADECKGFIELANYAQKRGLTPAGVRDSGADIPVSQESWESEAEKADAPDRLTSSPSLALLDKLLQNLFNMRWEISLCNMASAQSINKVKWRSLIARPSPHPPSP